VVVVVAWLAVVVEVEVVLRGVNQSIYKRLNEL